MFYSVFLLPPFEAQNNGKGNILTFVLLKTDETQLQFLKKGDSISQGLRLTQKGPRIILILTRVEFLEFQHSIPYFVKDSTEDNVQPPKFKSLDGEKPTFWGS